MFDTKSKSRRQVILEESAILFHNMGYSATSMKDIAERIGVKAASLYNHINSKQEILSVLLLNISHKFYNGILDVDNSSYSFKEKLREIIKMHIRIATENQNVASLITQDWKHLEEPSLSEFKEIRHNYQNIFRKVVADGMKSGELKSANIEITINIILSSLRWLYDIEVYSDTRNVSVTELEHTILKLVFNGVDAD